MNICVDVGNSTIAVGAFNDDELLRSLSITTDLVKTSDEYETIINQQIKSLWDIDVDKVNHIVYSSVVPEVNVNLKNALKRVFRNAKLFTVSPGIKTGLLIKVDNPLEIGSDLIADLVGAKEKYGFPIIIADLGTASKILLIDNKGAFSVATISPGLTISAQSLSNKASLLPNISLEAPKSVLSKNTIDAMNVGVVYGHAEMIKGLINRIENELGYKCKHILTGGSSHLLKSVLDMEFIFDDKIALYGLNLICKKNEVR